MSTLQYVLILAVFVSTLHADEVPLVYVGKDGRLVYTPHANAGETNKVNVIPDFSRCGYMGGGVKIPDVPVKIVIEPQDGPDRVRIQAAIDAVSKMPLDVNGFRGAVLIKAGTYIISEGGGQGLSIRASGVVVRGEGQGLHGTILQAVDHKRHSSFTVGPPKGAKPEYAEGPVSRIADAYVGTGATTFSIADAKGFAVGDTIRVYFTPNQTWLDETCANAYMNKDSTLWTTERYTIPFERTITAISGYRITINSPIVCPMQERYGGGEVRKITLSKGQRLANVGIENVSTTCPEDGGDKNRISDGILFEDVINGWISGVTVYHQYDALVTLNQSSFITVQDCASLKPVGPKRGGYRYTYYIGSGSHHCLIQRCYAYDGRHDFVTYAYSPGPNVFLDCVSQKGGTQGPHQRWSSGILFDNIIAQSRLAIAEHRGDSGTGHGWTGVSDLGWNVKAAITCDAPSGFQNFAIGCIGQEAPADYIKNGRKGVHRGYYASHGTHVTPRSLYLKQLEDRLGTQAVYNVTTEGQRQAAATLFYPLPPKFASEVMCIFDKPAEVVIRAFRGEAIHYTLDGSMPRLSSPRYTPPLLVDKPCMIRAIAVDKDTRPSPVAEATVTVVPVVLKPISTGVVQPGELRCKYYEGKWPSGKVLPDFTQLMPKAESVEPGVVMSNNVAKDYFALVYTGYIDVPVDGGYTFFVEANDGANLLVGGHLVVDNTVGGVGSVGLYAGRHTIEIQYWEKQYDAFLRIFWSGPGFEKTPLPASILSHSTE